MGDLHAAEYAALAAEGAASLRLAVSANLTSNHFPPLPSAYTDPVIEAIEACRAGEWDTVITLPEGINPVPRCARFEYGRVVVKAADLVEVTHSWAFVGEGEED